MKKPYILIIDDEVIATDALTHVLERHGMKTRVIREGGEVMEALNADTYDFIILDIILSLSEVDGWQLLQRIKSDEKTSMVPVAILSNAGLEHEIARGKELGADVYWVKAHTSIQDVASRIEAALQTA